MSRPSEIKYIELEEHPGYKIGSDGSAWTSLTHTEETIDGWTRLKSSPDKDGYLRVSVEGKSKPLHTLVCTAFHGPRPRPHYQACHENGKNQDNRAENLRWDSPKANKADQEIHGTVVRGEAHHKVTFGDPAIELIRTLAKEGWTQQEIADHMSTKQPTISRILNGKRRAKPCPTTPTSKTKQPEITETDSESQP